MRRYSGHLLGEQFCGNKLKKEVHDLDQEKPECQINEILYAGNEVPFKKLSDAFRSGYDSCPYCIKWYEEKTKG